MVEMKKLTIIISGMPGSGKTTIAKTIAKKYGLKYLCGGDALKEMAIARGFKPGGVEWWETEEGRRFFAERERNPEFDKEVDRILLEKAKQGGVVITTRTLPYLGAPGIKIWLAVSQEERARRIAGRDKIHFEQALEKIKERDSKEKAIYKRYYGFELDVDLSPFDFIIETDKLAPRQTAAETIKFIEAQKKIKS